MPPVVSSSQLGSVVAEAPIDKLNLFSAKSLSLFVGGSGRCFYLVPDTVVYGRGFGEYIRAVLNPLCD